MSTASPSLVVADIPVDVVYKDSKNVHIRKIGGGAGG
jgi:hypothetical protein